MIIVIPYTREQTAQTERLVDFIFWLNGREKLDACVLVAANDCHAEYVTKIRLSAEVAFNQVESISGDPAGLFNAAVDYADNNLKSSWLYLEPDNVPIKKNWQHELEIAYRSQPKKILGAHLKMGDGKIILQRNSIYPPDLARYISRDLASMSTKSPVGGLFQVGKYEKREDVNPNTVLYCSDKSGELIKAIRKEIKK